MLKPSTQYGYRSMIDNYLLPEFGLKPLPQIGPGDLTAFFERARTGKRKNYLLNLYSLLRVMFEVAVENDRVERSPVRRKLHRPNGSDGVGTRRRRRCYPVTKFNGCFSKYPTSTERCSPALR